MKTTSKKIKNKDDLKNNKNEDVQTFRLLRSNTKCNRLNYIKT
jgi:hypothetical protein